MSCRVFSRSLEECIMTWLITYARQHGFKSIIGKFTKTPKNSYVKDLYKKLNFKKVHSDNNEKWCFDLNGTENLKHFIRIQTS